MSRVLKFRIWDKANKEYMILGATGLDARNGDVIDYYNEGNRLGGPEEYDVEQYTGSTDKNGKEIYEGDIVKCYSRGKLLGEYQVIWNEDCGGFECVSLKPLVDGGDRMLRDVRVFNEISIRFRVIGNIHENKELWNDSEK